MQKLSPPVDIKSQAHHLAWDHALLFGGVGILMKSKHQISKVKRVRHPADVNYSYEVAMKIILCLAVTTTQGTVFEGHGARKVENHCSVSCREAEILE